MRMGRILEAGAQGIMYPRCDDAAEAREVVTWAKFAPLGRRGFDGSNPDAPYGSMAIEEYIRAANEQTFVVIQIEDEKALGNAGAIAEVEGVDVLFLGSADFTILSGIPGQLNHPRVKDAMKALADAARRAGKHWGMPMFTMQQVREAMDLGARFLWHGSDFLLVKNGLEAIRRDLAPLGVTFDGRI
jgi:4-hydroxy-2-oxoheptanedioate aldolase